MINTAVVVTTINPPNEPLRAIADECARRGHRFIVAGDSKTPAEFHIPGCSYYSVEAQLDAGLEFPRLCPLRSYSRKNAGYLLAMRDRPAQILETDDDNIPGEGFWRKRELRETVPVVRDAGWTNVYRYFTDANIWPRGLPLDAATTPVRPFASLPAAEVTCPIQQALADDDPDVDAIYRLLLPLPLSFRRDRRLALARNSWCPFNSQATAWLPEAYVLLYLPSHCSFRMTDIWRSFVAQRICWLNDWAILFESPTVRQERNTHDLMRDFAEELPGYLNNRRIADALSELELKPGAPSIADNMRICYQRLIDMGLVGEAELPLLDAWHTDIEALSEAA